MGKTKRQKKTSNRKTQPPAFTKVKKKVGKKQIPTKTRVDFKSRQIPTITSTYLQIIMIIHVYMQSLQQLAY